MKKLYKVLFLIILLITLSTYSYNKTSLSNKSESHIFKIKNIEIENNSLIKKEKIKGSLEDVYNQNIFLIKGKKIKKTLKKINFIQNVEVRKKYPNTKSQNPNMSQDIIFWVGGFSKFLGKRMLFTKRAVARRLSKAESWHKAHFEVHGEEINLPPRI